MLFLNAAVPDEERWRGDLCWPIRSPVQRPNQLFRGRLI